jgi:hypothetical protein
MATAADFRWKVRRFRFRAVDELRFPDHAGNVLRGVLGYLLEPGVFRPPSRPGLPSGLRTPPPPFVLRAPHLNGRMVAAGSEWEFRLNVFDPDLSIEPEWGTISGARVEALGFDTADARVDLAAATPGLKRLRVEFETPAELKGHDAPDAPPPFGVLLKRVRDRVATLRLLYGEGELALDFRALGERAEAVQLVEGAVAPVELDRRSRRTGQVHAVGGFLGAAVYEGELGEFLPWLQAAEATGVGRHTVWGNGALRVTPL